MEGHDARRQRGGESHEDGPMMGAERPHDVVITVVSLGCSGRRGEGGATMDLSVICECGRTVPVWESDAGGEVFCSCSF
jgi:hypothetical protein